MANMGEEGEGIPLLPKYDDFVYTEDKETLVNRFKEFIKRKAPKVDFKRIVIGLGKKSTNQGKAVAFGERGDAHFQAGWELYSLFLKTVQRRSWPKC